jgi:hypothetical protein
MMKKKNLLAAIAVAAITTIAFAADRDPSVAGPGSAHGSQQVIVNNHYLMGGYEYTSRIKRFHTSYVTFDFYSPMYTEVYWYRYTPYTWGVSIYDDWYYYGGNVSRHSWTSGFGGSYWWGYEPWWGHSSGIGYGWNSWYGRGISYSVNFYLGRPHYHYPVAYSGWHSHRYANHSRPLTVINNNTYNYYYGSEKRSSYQGSTAGYNPANPSGSGRRSGYTTTGGRSSSAGTAQAASGSTGTQAGTQAGTQTGTRSGAQTGTRSSTRPVNQGGRASGRDAGDTGNAQTGSEKDKSNNGLRMGQHRRGVADPPEPGDNGLPRTNNPNVNDRTDPGREQGNATRSSGTRQTSADRTPAGGTRPAKTQGSVMTTSQRRETTMRQGSPPETKTPSENTAQKKREKSTGKSSEAATPSKESGKTTTPASRRR